jgi:hypothetical protein
MSLPFLPTIKTSNLILEVSLIMTALLKERPAGLLPVLEQLLAGMYAAENNYFKGMMEYSAP